MPVARRLLGHFAYLLAVVWAGCAMIYMVFSLAPGSAEDVGGTTSAALGGPVGFWDWALGAVQGDLGYSIAYRMGAPVVELVGAGAVESGIIVGLALLFAMIGATLLASLWQNQSFVRTAALSRIFTYVLSAAPAFVLAYWAVFGGNAAVFAWIKQGTIERPSWFPLPHISSWLVYFLASSVMAMGSGMLMEYARNLHDEIRRIMQADFILFARASGRPLWRHILPSLVGPFATAAVNRLTALFGSAVVIEKIFAINGLGSLTWEAALSRDWPLVLGTTFTWAVVYALCRLVVEILILTVDPRARADGAADD